MDITKSNSHPTTNKLINGETVNYSVCFSAVTVLFLCLKQLLKIACSMQAGVAVGISAAIGAAVLFLLEKKYVFLYGTHGKPSKQILLWLFRCAVDLGIYKITDFVFGDFLQKGTAFVYLITLLFIFFFNYYFDRLLLFDVTADAAHRRNGRCFRLFYSNRFVLASMLLAGACITVIYLIFQLYPFGKITILRMDLYHQYAPLFSELYDRVIGHNSFLYSWNSGGGSSFLGNYFNYLSSPLSVIIFLFDRKEIPYAITLIIPLKGILSAGTFSYYLKKSHGGHSLATAALGVFYTFCAYFLAYYWNIMWLDGMMLLPLIVLGIENIINKRRLVLYTASLTLLLYSSYYMGYMLCIFSVIYFLAYYVMADKTAYPLPSRDEKNARRPFSSLLQNRFLRTGTIFAVGSLLSGLLCAVTLLPVYFILKSSSATSDTFPSAMTGYFDLLQFLASHLAALETTIRSSGKDVLPNVYCSVLTLLLVPLYIANPRIRLKEKSIYVLLLLFFFFSFNNNMANFIWHAFHFPNDLPYRFSFIYSFLLLVVAFRSIKHLQALAYRDIAFVGMGWILLIVLLQKYPTNKFTDFTLYATMIFLLIWTGVLLLIQRHKLDKFVLSMTVFAVAFCEIIVATPSTYLLKNDFDIDTANYDSYRQAIHHIYQADKSLYRSELCYLDTRMDTCTYGYRGMSTFSSMAYADYSQTQYSLGMFGNRINSYTYNTQTPVYNLMYGIRYLMHGKTGSAPSADFYRQIYTTDDAQTAVYENNYFLPLVYTVPGEIKNWEVEEGNPFIAQQQFMTLATGVTDIFVPVKFTHTDTYEIDCETIEDNGTFFFEKETEDSTSGSIDITLESATDSNLFVYISSPEIENVNYYWQNGNEEETTYQNINEPYIMDLGMHKKGDAVKISLECGSIDALSSYFEIYAYSIDKERFEAAYDLLNLGTLQVTSFNDTHIDGTLEAGYDGLLYTSIPYDEGWRITVDGKDAPLIKIGNAQLACAIKKGTHQIHLQYTPKGLHLGAGITGATWIAVALFAWLKKRKNNAKFGKNK